jgi:tRNA pseudouridine38-40 synthase
MLRHIAMSVAYDGTSYAGFQRQPGQITIQQVLEEAVGAPVRGAGRTDAGVHALGQVVDFWYEGTVPTNRLPRALQLPDDIVAVAAWDVPDEFHAQKSAVGKQYRYLIWRDEVVSPFVARYTWHYPGPLDVAAMRAFAANLEGRHDFTPYSVTGRPVASGIRTVTRCEVAEQGAFLVVRVAADGFLYKMVRRIVGRLWEVGRDAPDLHKTVPACGLCLEHVRYGGGLAPALTDFLPDA